MVSVTALFGPSVNGPRSTLVHGAGARSALSDLLQVVGVAGTAGDADAMTAHPRYPLTLRHVHAGTPLYHEGAPAEAVYFVRSGTFRTSRMAEDGYEQVLDFPGRGELLGFDAVCMGHHPSAAVALEDAAVYAVLVCDITRLGQDEPALVRALHLALSRQFARHAEITDMMAAVSAEVRLARFVVVLAGRQHQGARPPEHLHLCMNRRDIASHLGVAHETVSRAFGALAAWGYLEVDNRQVRLLDLAGLRELARSTRGHTDDGVPHAAAHRHLVHGPAGWHAEPVHS